MLQVLVPVAAAVDPADLRRPEYLAHAPQQASVDPHELRLLDLVRLVEDAPDLVVVRPELGNDVAELVGDVELVGVEEEEDEVGPLRKPLHHVGEVVAPGNPLLLPAQHSRAVDDGDALEQLRGGDASLELVEEGRAEVRKAAKGQLRDDGQGVALDDLVLLPVHNGYELVGGRLGTDVRGGIRTSKEVRDESRFAGGVLSDEEDGGLGLNLAVRDRRVVKGREQESRLYWTQLLVIQRFETFYHTSTCAIAGTRRSRHWLSRRACRRRRGRRRRIGGIVIRHLDELEGDLTRV
mmetsp:Transcript_4280/g.8165  ORF Transcript_4280/g.8165 Transcript_4280/m.8165 type:complete len:294 (-) Transcript_4280:94-975(-)